MRPMYLLSEWFSPIPATGRAVTVAHSGDGISQENTTIWETLKKIIEMMLRLWHYWGDFPGDRRLVRGDSRKSNTPVLRKTDTRMRVTFPADTDDREARLYIRSLEERGVVRVTGSEEGIVFPVTDGGKADDPNGPNLLRPDDRHGLILTDAGLAPGELLATVSLAADREMGDLHRPVAGGEDRRSSR